MAAEWGISWIYWDFWIWKTLSAVVMIIDKLKRDEIIFTNIKLERNNIPNPNNYYYFDSFDEFVDIMKFAWYFAQEVIKENDNRRWKWKALITRKYRPRFNVFFDEMWIHANANDFKQIHDDYWTDLYQYLLQTRKLFQSIYCIVQKPRLLWNGIRMHVSEWYTYKPLWESPTIWKHFWAIRKQDLNQETWAVDMKKDIKLDTEWNWVTVETPKEFSFRSIYFRKSYFKCYDDLYLNKLFEIEFWTNYLTESWLLYNLANRKVSNFALLETRKLYEPLIQNIPIDPVVDNSYLKACKVLIIDLYNLCVLFTKRSYNFFILTLKNIIFYLSFGYLFKRKK